MSKDTNTTTSTDIQGHYITPDQLCIGLYIHLDLGWMQHPFTFGNFKIKDEEQIRKLHSLHLKKIRFDPDRSDIIPEFPKTVQITPQPATPEPQAAPAPATVIDPKERQLRLQQLNAAILDSKQSYNRHAQKVRETVRNLSHYPEQSREAAEVMVKDWVDSIITEPDVALHAIDQDNALTDTSIHPMNVTVLALMLAKSLDMREQDATTLGLAAMFHDVGKEDELKKKSFVDLHCEIGSRIAESAGLSEHVCRTIAQHHEFMDGTGLPKHLSGGLIDPLARVLCLVNHFDNLCNPASNTEALTPYEALSVMYATQQDKFDASMLRVFVRSLGIYPPGSVVQLSNGVYGIVLSTNPGKPMRPLVMLHLPKVARETPVILDLAEEPAISIKKCVRPEHLPAEVRDYLQPRKRLSYYFLKSGQGDNLLVPPEQDSPQSLEQRSSHHRDAA